MTPEESREIFGRRIQRCSGCFIAFYIKDLWIDPEGTFFCSACHHDEMVHFDQYSAGIDFTELLTTGNDGA